MIKRLSFYSARTCRKRLYTMRRQALTLNFFSDEYEKSLDENLSYRFCPGYGGSDVTDLKHVFGILKPEKIGVTLSEAFYILPAKSMAGIIAVGGSAEKTCKGCVVSKNCKYLKGGVKCYD